MNAYFIVKTFIRQNKINRGSNIRFFNFWKFSSPQEVWFYRFIKYHKIDNGYKGNINFYSLLGPVDVLKYRKKGINIFFSGENLHADRFNAYLPYCNVNAYDLSLGFDKNNSEKYCRHPLWIHYMFEPESTYEDIKRRVSELSDFKPDNRTKFCSMVASHDWNGIRGQIFDTLSSKYSIDSSGNFRKNTDRLKIVFDDNKVDFIKEYKFNICPENSNADGYVTEKIFESIAAGCIPIYWGSNNEPELDVLNKNAILFWNPTGDNNSTISNIDELMANESKYLDFVSQPKFTDDAADHIWDYFVSLERKLKLLIGSTK